MGIRGLTTYLDNNCHLLSRDKLRDMTVVIDGNNLFHFLYSLYRLRYVYGGDYDDFADAVKTCFEAFAKCNIQCIVVFDGPYKEEENKFATTLSRAKKRLDIARLMVHHKRAGLQITPLHCIDAFISTLDRLGVKHITFESEADSEIAALAKYHGYAVMTNDSDFFINDLKGGVILLDYLDLKLNTDREAPDGVSPHYIVGRMYYSQKMITVYSIDADRLALFGTMLGTDKVDADQLFRLFFYRLQHPSARKFTAKRHQLIHNILHYLKDKSSFELALEDILNELRCQGDAKMQNIIMHSVDSYRNIPEPRTLTLEPCLSSLRTYIGQKFPDWLLSEMYAGHILGCITNVLISRRIILQTQPEHMNYPSAYECTKVLRSTLYGILTLPDNKQSSFQDGKLKNIVKEFDRVGNAQIGKAVSAQYELKGVKIPSLYEITELDRDDRIAFLCLAHGIERDIIDLCPPGSELYIMCLIYWVNNAKPVVNRLQLMSVIVCMLKLCAIDVVLRSPSDQEEAQATTNKSNLLEKIKSTSILETIRQECSSASLKIAEKIFEKILNSESLPSKKPVRFRTENIHTYSQLQCCIYVTQAMNQALRSPYSPIIISEVFNGTFLYHFYQKLKTRSAPDLFVFEALGQSHALKAIYDHLINLINDSLKTGVMSDFPSAVKKKGHRKSKSKVKVKHDSDNENTDSDYEEIIYADDCELENKFSGLIITDE